MPDKLTDSEIVKGIEYCSKQESDENCKKCPIYKQCNEDPCYEEKLALDLINRLQAENERLEDVKKHIDTVIHRDCEYPSAETYNKAFQKVLEHLYDNATAKAEAYKEFAERLKKALYSDSCRLVFESDLNIFECAIDNLLKEMLGGKDTESALPPSRQAATPPSMKEAMKNFKPEEE